MSDEQPAVTEAQPEKSAEAGVLYLIGTPIGNLEDLSYRAVSVLRAADVLACEDTRRTSKLLAHYEIPRPAIVFSLHEHNEQRASQRVLGLLEEGKSIALCSDAGMPLISDPGYQTVRTVTAAGYPVVSIPGPSAVLSALSVSGMPTSSFTFLGFPPRKSGPRRRLLEQAGASPHTLILFESPQRVGALLHDALEVLGDREACVCVELTKLFESARRGYLSELAAELAPPPGAGKRGKARRDEQSANALRGEVTVVIAGENPKFQR